MCTLFFGGIIDNTNASRSLITGIDHLIFFCQQDGGKPLLFEGYRLLAMDAVKSNNVKSYEDYITIAVCAVSLCFRQVKKHGNGQPLINAQDETPGSPNTSGGGGGGGSVAANRPSGAKEGSGIVIISYPAALPRASGGRLTSYKSILGPLFLVGWSISGLIFRKRKEKKRKSWERKRGRLLRA